VALDFVWADVLEEDAAAEDFVEVLLVLVFLDLGLGAAVDGPALGARLGGLKGSRRFFWAGGSPVIFFFFRDETFVSI